MITDFKLDGASIRQLFRAINAHLDKCGIEPEDRGFGVCGFENDPPIPERRSYRWLVAWAVEGESEGFYIHCGAIRQAQHYGEKNEYIDFGHAKCYSADQAYAIAREAQRFLTAALWN